MKDRKNKMTSNEASTANLPNIIFYSVGGKKRLTKHDEKKSLGTKKDEKNRLDYRHVQL